jgi:DNA-binding CsgD family transcriptional regulator
MTARPLSDHEATVLTAYGRGVDIAAIAADVGDRREQVGWLLTQLCGLNRLRAREMARTRSTPAATPPPPPAPPVRPVDGRHGHNGRVLPRFTPRQTVVLTLVADGLDRAAIAERLGIEVSSVRGTTGPLFTTLAVRSLGELAEAARKLGYGTTTPAEPAGDVNDRVPVDDVDLAAILAEHTAETSRGAP